MTLRAVLPLAACSVGPTFVDAVRPLSRPAGRTLASRAVTTSREDYGGAGGRGSTTVLSRLVDMAYAQNLTLMEAGARVIEARAALGQAAGELYPQTQQLSGTADYLQPSETDATSNPNNLVTARQFWRVNLGARRPGARPLGQVPPRRRAGGRRLSRLDRDL